jgi:effector-binding domain-containing protein
MHTEPKIEHRNERIYVAIESTVAMVDIPTKLPPLIHAVLNWVDEHGVIVDGPPFFSYLSMSNNNQMQVDVGVPVKGAVKSENGIHTGVFPAGQYATVTHKGDFRQIKQTHSDLQAWLEKNVSSWKNIPGDRSKWGPVTEFYPVNPEKEPNPDKWQADIECLLVKD